MMDTSLFELGREGGGKSRELTVGERPRDRQEVWKSLKKSLKKAKWGEERSERGGAVPPKTAEV